MTFALAMRSRLGGALAVLMLGAAPAGAATTLAQACTSAERDLCQTDRTSCERECSDLTLCVRRCCEAYQGCLTSHGCALRGPACPK